MIMGEMSAHSGSEHLDREECLRLLSRARLGRVALSVGALPAILPVRFVLHRGEIVFRAHPGTVLDEGTRGAVVAFEADGDAEDDAMWSVVVTGLARHLTAGCAGQRVAAAAPHVVEQRAGPTRLLGPRAHVGADRHAHRLTVSRAPGPVRW